jgi:hypothetical protein
MAYRSNLSNACTRAQCRRQSHSKSMAYRCNRCNPVPHCSALAALPLSGLSGNSRWHLRMPGSSDISQWIE